MEGFLFKIDLLVVVFAMGKTKKTLLMAMIEGWKKACHCFHLLQVMRTNLVNLWHPHGGVTITNMEYDAKSLNKRYRGYMRIRVRIDVRNPLMRQKKLILGRKWKLDIGISGIENMDSNKELGEEDYHMEIGEGKKRQRNSRAAGCNGNLMLECSGTGESPNKASPLAYVEGD
ncbi:hypothetical protein Gotri_007331 [Gossypium trilobum]|uniref:DUF4283 domain-containing protein n=1 Tax=Gossypium trilobum TaxID=34281 RepID=A0A7J9EH96_9ROSI|nr:hypothetical protein [Gossypium trilobum]